MCKYYPVAVLELCVSDPRFKKKKNMYIPTNLNVSMFDWSCAMTAVVVLCFFFINTNLVNS